MGASLSTSKQQKQQRSGVKSPLQQSKQLYGDESAPQGNLVVDGFLRFATGSQGGWTPQPSSSSSSSPSRHHSIQLESIPSDNVMGAWRGTIILENVNVDDVVPFIHYRLGVDNFELLACDEDEYVFREVFDFGAENPAAAAAAAAPTASFSTQGLAAPTHKRMVGDHRPEDSERLNESASLQETRMLSDSVFGGSSRMSQLLSNSRNALLQKQPATSLQQQDEDEPQTYDEDMESDNDSVDMNNNGRMSTHEQRHSTDGSNHQAPHPHQSQQQQQQQQPNMFTNWLGAITPDRISLGTNGQAGGSGRMRGYSSKKRKNTASAAAAAALLAAAQQGSGGNLVADVQEPQAPYPRELVFRRQDFVLDGAHDAVAVIAQGTRFPIPKANALFIPHLTKATVRTMGCLLEQIPDDDEGEDAAATAAVGAGMASPSTLSSRLGHGFHFGHRKKKTTLVASAGAANSAFATSAPGRGGGGSRGGGGGGGGGRVKLTFVCSISAELKPWELALASPEALSKIGGKVRVENFLSSALDFFSSPANRRILKFRHIAGASDGGMGWQEVKRTQNELQLGTNVTHRKYGHGIVQSFDMKGRVRVVYDNKEVVDHLPEEKEELKVSVLIGTRVKHKEKGFGTVKAFDESGRVHVKFDTGELHRYKQAAWAKKMKTIKLVGIGGALGTVKLSWRPSPLVREGMGRVKFAVGVTTQDALDYILESNTRSTADEKKGGSLLERRIVERLSDHERVVYEHRRFPPPLAPRDFVFKEVWKEVAPQTFVVLYENVRRPDVPAVAPTVRGEMLLSGWLLEPLFLENEAADGTDHVCRVTYQLCFDTNGFVAPDAVDSVRTGLLLGAVTDMRSHFWLQSDAKQTNKIRESNRPSVAALPRPESLAAIVKV